MARRSRAIVVGMLLTGTVVGLSPAPAGASVTAVASGTTVEVTVTGDETVTFGCDPSSSVVLVNGSPTSPTISCAGLTKATITGDDGNQTIDASGLDASAFTAIPTLTA